MIFICDSHRYIYIYIYTFNAFRCSESWRGSHSALDHPPLRFQLSLGPADLVLLAARCTPESLEMLANLGTVSMGKLVPKSPGQSSHFHTCPIKSGYGPYLDTEKNGCGIRNVAIYDMKKKQGISCCSSRQSTFITEASSHNC